MENTIRTNGTEPYDSVGFLTGLLIGGLVGFGATILFAPQSGIKTRDQLKQKSAELQNRTVDTFDDLVVLSHFDNRKILSGTRDKITPVNEYQSTDREFEYQPEQTSPSPKTKAEILSEELLANDSLGG
jgi:gas vesicle protein